MNNIELAPIPLDREFLEKILKDLELGLVVWREKPDTDVYKHKLERIEKLEEYVEEQY